jgi:hypothetical protein
MRDPEQDWTCLVELVVDMTSGSLFSRPAAFTACVSICDFIESQKCSVEDFYPSQIPDPKTATKRGVKKIFLSFLFLATHKIENNFIYELAKKKIWASLQRIIELFTSVADPDLGSGALLTPGSGIWNRFFPDHISRIPDPGFQTHIFESLILMTTFVGKKQGFGSALI